MILSTRDIDISTFCTPYTFYYHGKNMWFFGGKEKCTPC